MGAKKGATKVAAKVAGEEKPKAKKAVLFYANADKLKRARAAAKDAKGVKEAYAKLGGQFTEGYGIEPV